ncbi:ABC transporter ATP-binding protein [Streptomyces sp. NPDC051014]|uniref:ABC transporter ATP-binding protein n=1 Tax=Streptomyces sp. NPDC051014 TaxID=3155751 RepID=UPI0033BFF795
MQQGHALVEADHVTKMYTSREGDTVEALHDVSMSVADGEFVSIVGPSGCGKSTLVKMLCGLDQADGGFVRIGGETVSGPSSDVGIVFQNPVLLPWRSVLDNVRLPAQLKGRGRHEADRVKELLELVGLSDFARRLPSELSGGMQQRVAIARALVLDPRILVMDEPFGALDAMTRERMQLELLALWAQSNKSCVLVTHSIPEAVFLSDRVIVMSARPGRVLADVEIDLPRPRTLAMTADVEYGRLVLKLRSFLDAEGMEEPSEGVGAGMT